MRQKRKMVMAARDKYGGDIHVAERLSTDRNEEVQSCLVAALFGEIVFHNEGMVWDKEL